MINAKPHSMLQCQNPPRVLIRAAVPMEEVPVVGKLAARRQRTLRTWASSQPKGGEEGTFYPGPSQI